MKEKILFTTVLLLIKLTAFAQYGGTTGDLTWSFNLSDSTLTISGEGDMPDYDNYASQFAPWYNARDYISTVIIEPGVTNIGNKAFYSCTYLKSVMIPNSVTRIGNKAFQYCFRLPSITIPNNVNGIGNMAFEGCTNLGFIIIPKSVTSIGYLAFNDCTKLIFIEVASENNHYASESGILFDKNKTTLIRCPQRKTYVYVIPDNVKIIEDYAFSRCTDLTTIVIPNTVTDIGNYAFSYCENLNTMDMPHSVINLGEWAFSHCSRLTSVVLSNNIKIIRNNTFIHCDTLSSIFIPSSIRNIEKYAFFCLWSLSQIINLRLFPIYLDVFVFSEPAPMLCINLNNITLLVPTSAVQAYKNAYIWNQFNVVGGGILVNPVANDSEYGYTTGDGLYEMDMVATVTAFAYPDNFFINWTLNGEEVSTDNPYSFTVTEDVELVANFKHEVGIENIPMTSINVFPNPTCGIFSVTNYELQIEGVEVYDVFGRKMSQILYLKSHISNLIDISHLQTGIYFIRIQTEKEILTKKIIKL